MSLIQHHAILVTVDLGLEYIEKIAQKARDIGCVVIGPSAPQINLSSTLCVLCVVPDGSKEGWAHSDEGDVRRAKFIEYLKSPDVYATWVEVSYGELGPSIVEGCPNESLCAPRESGGRGAERVLHYLFKDEEQ